MKKLLLFVSFLIFQFIILSWYVFEIGHNIIPSWGTFEEILAWLFLISEPFFIIFIIYIFSKESYLKGIGMGVLFSFISSGITYYPLIFKSDDILGLVAFVVLVGGILLTFLCAGVIRLIRSFRNN